MLHAIALVHRRALDSAPMDRCFSHCVNSSWQVFAHVRRWYYRGDLVQATVYEHAQCRACSALSTRAYDVDVYELPGRQAVEQSAEPFQTFEFTEPNYGRPFYGRKTEQVFA